ncbi:MAG: ATP-binding cassette domain-containing protein, partial [Pseudomonadota bacterium]
LMRGDRLGLVGPNGAGKTTLLKLLIGELMPTAGDVRHGANLETIWLDQKRAALSETTTLTDVLTGGRGDTVFVNGKQRHVSTYLKDFLFLPEQARSPVKVLSGGERARLMLARALAQPSNLMVLDEPTNDLDLETLDLLQELLADYAGTLLLVSHDRDFLDRVCTSVLASEGDGRWVEYAGGFTDMVRQGGGGFATANRAAAAATTDDKRARSTSPSEKPAAPRTAKKLSFKDKHALETLPDQIAELEGSADQLDRELADPDLYMRDPNRFAAATTELAAVRSRLEEAEERWLQLEMKREALEQAS